MSQCYSHYTVLIPVANSPFVYERNYEINRVPIIESRLQLHRSLSHFDIHSEQLSLAIAKILHYITFKRPGCYSTLFLL